MSFKRNLKWSSIGTIARYLAQTISIVALARVLNPVDFGIVSASLVVINFLTTLAQFGSSQLIVTAKDKELGKVIFQSLFLSTILSVLFMVGLYIFSSSVSNLLTNENITVYINALIPVIILKSLSMSFEGILVRASRFKFIAISSSVSFIFGYFVVAFTLAIMGFQLWSLIVATVVQTALYLFLLVYAVYKHNQKCITISFDSIITNLKQSTLISYSQIVSNFTGQIDNYFVSKFIGLSVLGIYSRAYQLMVVPCNFIGQMINQVFLKEFSSDNHSRNSKIINHSLILNLAMSMSVTGIIFLFGLNLINIVLGPGWEAVQEPLLILSLSIYPRMLYKIGEPILYSNRNFKNIAFFSTLYLIMVSLLLVILIPYGIKGVAFAVLLGTGVYGIIMFHKIIQLYPDTKKVFYITLASYLSLIGLVVNYG